MVKDIDKIKKIYINKDIILSKTFESSHFKLKYDYTSKEVLNKLDALIENQTSKNKKLIDLEVDRPFYEYFFEILDELDSDKIFNLLSSYYFKAEMKKNKDLSIEDCSSRIERDLNNEYTFMINVPDQEKDSGMLYAAHIHELIHFPQLIRKKNYEYLEYSEVLSMYFEYLMYEKISKGKGKKIFLNNRVKQLYDFKEDFQTDLYYAKNSEKINLPKNTFSLTLANYMSYYEGLEFVLELIDLYDENKKKIISDMIYKVLFDQSSLMKEANNLKIESSKYSKILKII